MSFSDKIKSQDPIFFVGWYMKQKPDYGLDALLFMWYQKTTNILGKVICE